MDTKLDFLKGLMEKLKVILDDEAEHNVLKKILNLICSLKNPKKTDIIDKMPVFKPL